MSSTKTNEDHRNEFTRPVMPLSSEAQREEKVVAKQAAVDEKVRDQSLVQ